MPPLGKSPQTLSDQTKHLATVIVPEAKKLPPVGFDLGTSFVRDQHATYHSIEELLNCGIFNTPIGF